MHESISFNYTREGYIQAMDYLKSINHEIRELSTDGYTIVKLANEIKNKNEGTNKF